MSNDRRRLSLDPDAWYNNEDLARRWNVHPITIFNWVRRGVIPRPVKIGPNTSRWQGKTILQHEQARAGLEDA